MHRLKSSTISFADRVNLLSNLWSNALLLLNSSMIDAETIIMWAVYPTLDTMLMVNEKKKIYILNEHQLFLIN